MKNDNKAIFEENMKDDATKNIRANKHELHLWIHRKIFYHWLKVLVLF